MSFDVTVSEDALRVTLTLDFTNPHPGESMSVRLRLARTRISSHDKSLLNLISTALHEWDETTQSWIDIPTSIAYTAQAQAVVDAVRQSGTNQTAGIATAAVDDDITVEIGPVAHKGRVTLRLSALNPVLYDMMGSRPDGSDLGTGRLLPFALFLPWAPVYDGSGNTLLSVSLRLPSSAELLPVSTHSRAYHHLKSQFPTNYCMLAASPISERGYRWACLPPQPTFLVAWLAIPNPKADRLLQTSVNDSLSTQCTILAPNNDLDRERVTVSVPGRLMRVRIHTPTSLSSRRSPALLLHLTMSDSSGSTGLVWSQTGTVRDCFNKMARTRIEKRLGAIKTLLNAGLIDGNDIWAELVIAFDHTLLGHRLVSFRVKDAPESLHQSSFTNDATRQALDSVNELFAWLSGLRPNGGTDFVVPVRGAKQLARPLLAKAAGESLNLKTFIDFDTDGGHNGPVDAVLDDLEVVCRELQVCGGVVTGFGAWVSQDTASRVARVLGPCPALLSMQVDEPGLDRIFRIEFAAWVAALRRQPIDITVSGVQVLAAQAGNRLQFDKPDVVTDVNSVGAKIVGADVDQDLMLYVVSRLPDFEEVSRRIRVVINGNIDDRTNVRVADETLSGADLAYEWMSAMTDSKYVVWNGSVAVQRMRDRIEDDVSFAFNVPAPSGSTSYLGRAQTTIPHEPIDMEHAAPDPQPCLVRPPNPHLVPAVAQAHGFFGSPNPASLPIRNVPCAPSAPARPGCGSQTVGPVPVYFGSPAPSAAAPPVPPSSLFGGSSTRAASSASSAFSMGGPPPSFPGRWAPVRLESPISWADVVERSNGLCRTSKPTTTPSALDALHHSISRLQGVSVQFSCDVCRKDLGFSSTRYHCFDCDDFDECELCQGAHKRMHPLHRIHIVNPTSKPSDPVVDLILGMPSAAPGPPPPADRALMIHRANLLRLLQCMVTWWPLVRVQIGAGTFPETLDTTFIGKLEAVIQQPTDMALIDTAATVLDTIRRHITATPSAMVKE